VWAQNNRHPWHARALIEATQTPFSDTNYERCREMVGQLNQDPNALATDAARRSITGSEAL
jgi:hypothetical protein